MSCAGCRACTARIVPSGVAEARVAGFDNVSLDLMMWLPGQQVDEWLESVDQAIALGPEHLSLCLLEVSERAAQRGNGPRALVAGAMTMPRRVHGGDGPTRSDRLRACGSRTWRAPGADRVTTPNTGPTASGSGSAAAPFHSGRRALEERVGDRGLHRSNRQGRAGRG